MFARKLLVAIGALSLAVMPSWADEGWASRDHDFATRQLDDFVTRHERDLVDPVARGVRRARPAAPAARAGTTIVPERKARVPAAMAAQYPPRERARMERAFHELLAGYRKIEQQFGLPKQDLAGAVAAFLAGSYMGYHGTDFPDSHFPPLVEQMRSILAADPAIARAPTAARQEMYERMAIHGMFLANAQMALSRRPDPRLAARMREAGKANLEQFLKTDAERVDITAHGLVVR